MTYTRTIGSGQNNADINAWVADVQANRVTAGALTDNVIGAFVTGEVVVSAVQTVSGWTPSGSNFTTTIQAGSQSVGGFGGDQSFRPNVTQGGSNALYYSGSIGAAISSSSSDLLDVEVSLATVKYMQFKSSSTYAQCFVDKNAGSTGDLTIDSCIFLGRPERSTLAVLLLQTPFTIQNCLVVATDPGTDQTTNGIICVHNGNIYSCTITVPAGNAGTAAGGSYVTVSLIDTVLLNFTTDASFQTYNSATKNNATSNASFSQSGANPSGQVSVVDSAEFVNASSDFRLKSGSGKLKNTGASSSGVPTVDIVGTTRPQGTAYCIGCWEFVPPPPVTQLPFKRPAIRALLGR